MYLARRNDHLPFIFTVGISILLSVWINLRETVINPDAICYLLSAETYTQSGLRAAMQLCGQARWPFYSVLIAQLTQWTHLSYTFSAYLLDGLFSVISVGMFLLITQTLGGTRRVIWLAALIILLSHEFNSVRQYIIRDHGFWAFYLVSLYTLLRFVQQPRWLMGLMFSLSLVIATLFRIEGLVFLLTLPLVILFCQQYRFSVRMKYFAILNLPVIAISLIIGSWMMLHPQATTEKLSRVTEVFNQLQHGFTYMLAQYQHTKTALIQHVLTTDAARDAGLVLFLVLITWYLVNILGNLSWIYSFLVIYAWYHHVAQFAREKKLVLNAYLLVNLIITFCFFAQHLFLSKRYLIALSLIFMFWVPFALDQLYRERHHAKQKILLWIVSLAIIISALGGIFDFGHSKAYIRSAGDWVATNIPQQASLYANDYQLMYYTQHFKQTMYQVLNDNVDINHIAHGKWKKYDYLVIRLDKHDDAQINQTMKSIPLKPLQIFTNKHGDQVAIYQVKESRL